MAAVTNNMQRKASLSEELEAQNLLRLKTFSKSLEDLTSETLYSKWKRARASPAKNPGRRGRSASLITVPEMIREEKETEERSRKNSFYDLQEVFRPRFWSTGGIYEENESEATSAGYFGSLLPGAKEVLPPGWQQSSQEQYALNSSEKKINHLVSDDQNILIAKPVPGDDISAANTMHKTSPLTNTREVHSNFLREPPKKRDDIPIVVRAINDEELKNTRGILREKKSNTNKSEVKVIITPKRRASSPASTIVVVQPETIPEHMKNFNGIGRTCSEGSASGNARPLKTDKEGERASLRMYYTSLGCTTYAIVSQPLQTDKNENVLQNTTDRPASENVPMESHTSSGEGHQILKRLSRASSFKEESQREAQTGEVYRRLSVQTRRVTRPTARDLLSSIANTAHKTEKDRLRDIETAFDWVRKELADLRAQDKDIMRMFTKIQAGIRQIQMNRSISESSENFSFEEEGSPRYNTMTKSVSTTFTPLVKEISTYDTFPRRRASLI